MSRILVAYFSATGTTARAARGIAEALGADMYEIEPAIAGAACDVSAYDAVFVGFPVWWYVEPRIIDTFLESHDFSGKTIVPFATSGGSGLGRAPQRMQNIAAGSTVVEGRLLNGRQSADDLRAWAESLGL